MSSLTQSACRLGIKSNEDAAIMPNSAKARGKRFNEQLKELTAKRDELQAHFQDHRTGVLVDREPDDEAAEASENYSKDLAVATLERERRTLAEINHALALMETGRYGVCSICGITIPERRLQALPWARTCVQCAERGNAND
jgi:DnaK suppressor protein